MKSFFWNILAILAFSTSAFASNYPGDYPVWSDTQSNYPVQIKRDLQGSGAVALNIYYEGKLARSESLSVVVRVLYQDGPREAVFQMNRYSSGFFTRVTNGCLTGQLGGCAAEGTDAMKYLLQWAGRRPMILNALAVELAFVDGNGNWDSRYGANYTFYFNEHHAF